MNKLILSFFTLLFIAGFTLAAYAEGCSFYVCNRPFPGPFEVRGHKVYAPLNSLLLALGYSWKAEGKTVHVFAESGGGPELGGKGPLQISFEGRASSLALQQKRGGAWAEASALAEALNLLYLVNDSLNTIDLLIPAPRVAQSAHSDDKSKAKKKASVNKTDKAEPRRRQSSYFWTPSGIMPDILQSSPVSLESCDFYKDDGPYTPEPMLYMNSLVLKNNGGETLSVKVKICIRVDGAQVYEAEFGADSIPAGKSQKLNLEPSAWNNASGRPFMVQIKIASQ